VSISRKERIRISFLESFENLGGYLGKEKDERNRPGGTHSRRLYLRELSRGRNSGSRREKGFVGGRALDIMQGKGVILNFGKRL